MNDPIRHHYVPQFYLREWAGPDGRLFWYHRPFNRVVVRHELPKNIAYEPYLYTIRGTTDPQILEKKFFSDLDNYAALVLQRLSGVASRLNILEREDLKDTQRVDWTMFIQSLHLRGPRSLHRNQLSSSWVPQKEYGASSWRGVSRQQAARRS